MLKKIIKENLVDYIAMDIKAPLKLNFQFPSTNQRTNFQSISKSQFSKYENITSAKVNLNKIKESIEILKEDKIDYEFRTTVVPIIHTKEDIIQIAKEISSAKKYFLQQFIPSEKMIDEKYKKIKPHSKEILEKIRKEIKGYVKKVEIR